MTTDSITFEEAERLAEHGNSPSVRFVAANLVQALRENERLRLVAESRSGCSSQ